MNRACQLIEEMGAGDHRTEMVDVYSKKKEPVLPFDADEINKLLQQNIWKCFLQEN